MKINVKKVTSSILVCLLIMGAFIIGNSLKLNILSLLGLSSPHQEVEQIPESEPHTAEEVVTVETVVPIDDEGHGTIIMEQQQVPYPVTVDFDPVIQGEAYQQKILTIMTQKASAPAIAKKDGLWSIPVFKQTKAIIFHGEGTYSVDLSLLSADDFEIDDDEKIITIKIPKPVLSVKLLPDETEFFDSSNGMLRFGEMQITPEYMTQLESQGIERITETLMEDTIIQETANKFAKLSVKEIYEPIIKAQIDEAVENANDEFAIPVYYTINVEIKTE